jgi:hypothetical protein
MALLTVTINRDNSVTEVAVCRLYVEKEYRLLGPSIGAEVKNAWSISLFPHTSS